MRSLKVVSPAKINLYLRVVGKLPGGYHRLITLFHRISLADTLRLKKISQGFRLTCSKPGLSTGDDNLISRAYRLLQGMLPDVGGVSVHLNKVIPIGGGLGGGSSNAAAFLLGMKRLYRLPLSLKNLVNLGSALGSDVPFFIYDISQALGEGRGELIEPLALKRKLWFVLIVSPEGLSTKRVYESLPKWMQPLSLTKARQIARIAFHFLNEEDCFGIARGLHNDLEAPAIELNPTIQKMIGLMVQLGVPSAAMSGSGPTVFAILGRRSEAIRLARRLKGFVPLNRTFVCHSF